MHDRFAAFAIGLVFLQCPGKAEGPAVAGGSAGPAGTGVTGTVYRLDAVVTDARGTSIDDLKPDDFQVLEEGIARTIDDVQLVKVNTLASDVVVPITSRIDEQAEAARDNTRLLAVFLDEYHVTPGAGASRARELVARLIADRFGTRDLFAVVRPLDSLVDLRLTHDRAAILAALNAFAGRKGDYAPRTPFEANYIAADPSRIEAVRTQIVTSALNALAVHLGSLANGRKTIVFVSEGFARPARRRGEEPLPTLDSVVRSANRGGVSIYAIDPRALLPVNGSQSATSPSPAPVEDDRSGDRDTLRALADQTSGAPMLKPADVEAVTRRIVADSTDYYVITFRPAHGDDLGTFHPVQLRVKRTGTVVHARSGYWTPSADELLRMRIAAKAAEPKPPPEPPLHPSSLIRPWFGVARSPESDGRVRLMFVWEPASRVPGERTRVQPPARVALKAFRDGIPIFQGELRPSEAGAERGADLAPIEASFDVAPGRLRVQMTVEDASSHVLDTDVRDVIVAPLGGSVALGTPKVLRARNAREYREMKADPSFPPVAAREFSRTERLLVRVPAYGDGSPPTVTGRLLARNGSVMRNVTVEEVSSGLFQIDLPLAGLAPAEYMLELAAVSRGVDCKETIRFRVTS